jgi:hypothetical protein
MQHELTKLLRAVPFASFIIFTRDGEAQHVNNVERCAAGRGACSYVDAGGVISIIPYSAIDRITYKNGEEI